LNQIREKKKKKADEGKQEAKKEISLKSAKIGIIHVVQFFLS